MIKKQDLGLKSIFVDWNIVTGIAYCVYFMVYM